MKLLKEILRTAKELHIADSISPLGGYVVDKIDNIVNKYDGTTEEEFEAQKEQVREQIQEELISDAFDDEYCLALIDRWVDEYAQSEYDLMLASFYKYRTWETYFIPHLRRGDRNRGICLMKNMKCWTKKWKMPMPSA